jgi:hypothetical protein
VGELLLVEARRKLSRTTMERERRPVNDHFTDFE